MQRSRRHFIQYLSVAAAALLFPQKARAATGYSGPLWIFVHAAGGWDPTSLCDPKGWVKDPAALGETDARKEMNRSFAAADIRTVSNTTIRYAPIDTTNSTSTYPFSQFFERYGERLLVINGIDTQTNGHDQGTRFSFSGKLSEGHPSLGALIAAVHMPESPLGFITYGGYDYTAGIVAASRIGSSEIIQRLAFPNRRNASRNFHNASVDFAVKSATKLRRERELGVSTLASGREVRENFYASNRATQQLRDLIQFLPASQAGESRMLREAKFAMATYKAGMTAAVSIRSGGFDTHGDHDALHLRNLGTLLSGVDDILQEAQRQGLQNDIVVVIGSEFGRTPRYNNGNGKDHWPVGSMMLYGRGIRGGRSLGSTDAEHKVQPYNGITLNNGHIHQALRKLAGVERHPLATQRFPISESYINLLS